MIILTQLIYIIKGQKQGFEAFENIVIPIISKYNGPLLLRIRPTENSYIENAIDKPFEIHLAE